MRNKIMSFLYSELPLPFWVDCVVWFLVSSLFYGCFLLFYGVSFLSFCCFLLSCFLVFSERFYTRLFALLGVFMCSICIGGLL